MVVVEIDGRFIPNRDKMFVKLPTLLIQLAPITAPIAPTKPNDNEPKIRLTGLLSEEAAPPPPVELNEGEALIFDNRFAIGVLDKLILLMGSEKPNERETDLVAVGVPDKVIVEEIVDD